MTIPEAISKAVAGGGAEAERSKTASYRQAYEDGYKDGAEAREKEIVKKSPLRPNSLRITVEVRDDEEADSINILAHTISKEEVKTHNGKLFQLIIEDLVAMFCKDSKIMRKWLAITTRADSPSTGV